MTNRNHKIFQFVKRVLALALLFAIAGFAIYKLLHRDEVEELVDVSYQTELIEQLQTAKPGETVNVPVGRYYLDSSLRLSVEGLELVGAGSGESSLVFRALPAGSAALVVEADAVRIRGLTLADARGSAIFANGVRNMVIEDVVVESTKPRSASNGQFGIALSKASNVSIKKSTVRGASGAGIFSLGSSNVVIEDNRLSGNVTGVAVVSSQVVDLSNNTISQNSNGVLVMEAPGQVQRPGRNIRIMRNEIFENNRPILAMNSEFSRAVVSGVGVSVLGADEVEIVANAIRRHDGVNILVVSRPEGFTVEEGFDRFSEAVLIAENRLSEAGSAPTGILEKFQGLNLNLPFPDILWDGLRPAVATEDSGLNRLRRVCLSENNSIRVVNLAGGENGRVSRLVSDMECFLPRLEPVILPLGL